MSLFIEFHGVPVAIGHVRLLEPRAESGTRIHLGDSLFLDVPDEPGIVARAIERAANEKGSYVLSSASGGAYRFTSRSDSSTEG